MRTKSKQKKLSRDGVPIMVWLDKETGQQLEELKAVGSRNTSDMIRHLIRREFVRRQLQPLQDD